MTDTKNTAMARRIAEAVAAEGGRAWYVGGYVRDRLLGREWGDMDLEIHGLSPEHLLEILRRLGEPTLMGAGFGIFGLKHYDLDITMPRKAGVCRGGKTELRDAVDPFAGMEAAARRRDFTINAMMLDVLTEELCDPVGGRQDLEQGILRHADDRSFASDPLRVLRAACFAARFGFRVAEQTMERCCGLDLSGLPRERVFGEVQKALLQTRKPSVFFSVLRQMDHLSCWFPEAEALIGVEQDPVHHPEGDVWNHTMAVLDEAADLRQHAEHPLGLMLAALCHDFGKVTATQKQGDRIRALGHEEAGLAPAGAFLNRLTGEGKLRRYVENQVLLHMRPNLLAAQNSGAKAACALLDRSVSPGDLLLLARADHFGKKNPADYENTARYLQQMLALYRERMTRPHVTGADLIGAGVAPGAAMGQALQYAHKLRLAGVEKESALKQTLAYCRQNGIHS